MNEYTITLFLLYMKNIGNDYDFSEARKLLGVTQNQLEFIINDLLNNGMLEYNDYILKITYKGLRYLISNNKIEYHIKDGIFSLKNIDKTSSMSIYEPYVPENFDKKV